MSDGSEWYQIASEPSDIPYSQKNQFLGWDFFAISYNKTALEIISRLLQLSLTWILTKQNVQKSDYKFSYKGDFSIELKVEVQNFQLQKQM